MAFLEGVFPRVIAHRGLALAHAENTVGAFQAAIDVGADILETDVHLSKDGAVIIAHDPDLGRVAQRPGLVSDLTQRELADIDLGWGEGFPTLDAALRAFPDRKFNIDLKTPGAVGPFAEVVKAHNAENRVLATSFDEPTRQAVINLLPEVVSSTSQSMVIAARMRSWLGLPSERWEVPPEIVAMQIPPSAYGLALVTPSMLTLARRKGLEVHVWTINDPHQMRRLWRMGVHGIVTDRSDLAIEVRGELFPEQPLG
ncbi:MAG: glycerophosphodiester phosphodiesterase [Microbacteriaceae bacterium]|mgnify:FL=1|jgi:glycerophosphoryl diester phosphodiesterase|nr:glycerophosphodiester phosphodiesterase [Microbacteriaceae bacterium]